MIHLSDRKYRHQGYQDSGGYSSNTNRGPRPQTPYEPQNQRIEGAPRGRTAGGFGPEVFKCNACGTQTLNPDGGACFGPVSTACQMSADCVAYLACLNGCP